MNVKARKSIKTNHKLPNTLYKYPSHNTNKSEVEAGIISRVKEKEWHLNVKVNEELLFMSLTYDICFCWNTASLMLIIF